MTLDQFLHYFLVVYSSLSAIFGLVAACAVVPLYMGKVPLEKINPKHRVKVLIAQGKIARMSPIGAFLKLTLVALGALVYIAIAWPFALMR